MGTEASVALTNRALRNIRTVRNLVDAARTPK